MPSDSAALLTTTQRRRIRDQFGELNNDQTRRDQQRIRERLAAGLGDFEVLVDYPDEQFRMAVEEYSDEALIDALADGTVVLERIRERRGIDPERVTRRASERTHTIVDGTEDTATLDRLRFEPPEERRRRLIEELRDELGPSPWTRRANKLLRFATWIFLPVFLMWVFDQTAGTTLLDEYTTAWGALTLIGVPMIAGALTIKLLQMLKYDVIPAGYTALTEPQEMLSAVYDRIVAHPGRTIRRSWERL